MVAEFLIPQTPAEVLLEVVQLFKSPYLKQVRQDYADNFDDTRSWVDPNGYRLSDRLWKQKDHVRAWIDQEIQYALAHGMDAMELADRLETALYPKLQPVRDANGKIIDTGAKGILTRTPRNGPGSYAARRLARTEVTRAFGASVDRTAAALNVDVKWALSNRHPKVDICDSNAAGSSPGKPMGVYTVNDCPPYPAHPHCLCTKSTYDDRSDDDVLAYLREKYDLPSGPLPPPLPKPKKKPGPPKGYKYPAGAKKPGPKPKPKYQGPAILSDAEVAGYASRSDAIQAAAAKKKALAAAKAKAAKAAAEEAAAKKVAMQQKIAADAAKKKAAEEAAKKAAIKAKKQATWAKKKAEKEAAEAAAKKAAEEAAKKAAIKAKKQATWAAKKQAQAQAALDAQKAAAQATQAAQAAKKAATGPVNGIMPSGVTAPKTPVDPNAQWAKLDVINKPPGTILEADVAKFVDDSELKEIMHYAGGYNATPALKANGINFGKTKPKPGEPDWKGSGIQGSSLPTGSPNEVKIVVRTKSPLQGTASQISAEVDSWKIPTFPGETPAQIASDIRSEALIRGYDSIIEIHPNGAKSVYVLRHDNYRIVNPPPAPKPTYTPPKKSTYTPPPKVQGPTPGPVPWKPEPGKGRYTQAEITKKYAADKAAIRSLPRTDKARGDWEEYKGSAYIKQNRHLRFGHPDGRDGYGKPLPPSWDTSYIADMDTLHDGRYVLEKNADLWRGTSHDPGDTDPELVNAKPGDVLWDPAFLSTSFDTKVADNFKKGYSGRDTVLYYIDAPAGTPYVPLDGLGIIESELVFPRGTQMIVTDAKHTPRSNGGTFHELWVTLAPADATTTKPKVPTKLRGKTP